MIWVRRGSPLSAGPSICAALSGFLFAFVCHDSVTSERKMGIKVGIQSRYPFKNLTHASLRHQGQAGKGDR